MRRIAGTFMLLTGLSGCISFTGQPTVPDRKATDYTRGTAPGSTTSLTGVNPTGPAPASSSYDPHPDHYRYGSYSSYTGSTQSTWNAAPPSMASQPVPGQTLPAQPMPDQSLPGQPMPGQPMAAQPMPGQALPGSASSLTPLVTTPPKAPPAVSTTAAGSSVVASTTLASNSVVTPSSTNTMLSASTPPAVTSAAATPANDSSDVQPASFNSLPEAKTSNKTETAAAKSQFAMPNMTGVRGATVSEVKTVHSVAPLMRLVNTKRITLNFEVKDVGPSGLSTVELWYTQNCRDWKKYDAPTNSKAYVVEVDEEGMYGFTLVARSGLGLGKEAPQPGDQPQVWVVVDLTKPDMQLSEVTPTANYNNKVQQVTIKWKASDKNLDRQPISLFYAEHEEGPWKTIGTALSNTGSYVWQVPADARARCLIRGEAVDLAGNVGRAQSAKPILLDTRVPSVTILNVEANNSH